MRTRLRLVTDLQTNVKAQASSAYARKVKISNLKEMARTMVFIQELGIGSREELRQMLADSSDNLEQIETAIHKTDQQVRNFNQQIHFAGQYYASRTTHAEFMKSWNKGRFRSKHKEELARYDEAVSFFKDHTNGNIPSIQDIKEQKKDLLAEKEKLLSERNALKLSRDNLQTAVVNIDVILGSESDRSKVQRKTRITSLGNEQSL